jgi:hypothetical protein
VPRLAVHLAVWAPFVLGVVQTLRLRGWRNVGDGAVIALRSWDVLTASGPLVGQASRLGPAVYDPGPLQYWLQAIPVHLDPRYGALCAAALWCMIACSLAVEAAWSALGGLGGLLAAAVILGTVVWRPGIAVQPYWNPWFGAMFFLAALAAAWAVLSGHRRWWAVLVVTGSVASQAHLMFALAAAALVLLALAVGVADTLRAKAGYWWAAAGLIAGVACWAAPLVQQFTGTPGNMTALLTSQGTGKLTGPVFGLKSLAASTQPPPIWLSPSHGPASSLIAGRSAGFAVAALVLLAAVLAAAIRPLRSRRLAGLAAVSLVTSITTLVTYSRIPVAGNNLTTLSYLGVLLFPLGALAWLTAGSVAVLGGRRVIGRLPGPWTGRAATAGRVAAGAGLAAVAAVALASSAAAARGAPTVEARLGRIITRAAGQVERAVPGPPVALRVLDRQVQHYQQRLTMGIVWALRADGYRPQVRSSVAPELAPQYVFHQQPIPRVTVRVQSDGALLTTCRGPCRPVRGGAR